MAAQTGEKPLLSWRPLTRVLMTSRSLFLD